MFSVNSEEEARELQVFFCKLAYDPEPALPGGKRYILPFSGDVRDLDKVSEMFRRHYAAMEKVG